MDRNQNLWKKAKELIPGGNSLLSKRPDMFLPDGWPTYFSEARGCEITDLNGQKYLDTCIMGIGTNLLGYSHPEINGAVFNAIERGNMSSLNAPEEVELAERLVELHPWADMVRFARTGGEANAIAVRIARAASGKSKVAVCGYHGWHDWYLSVNLNENDSLDEHLLPGLDTTGVPQNLFGLTSTFSYNSISSFDAAVRDSDVGVVVMEVQRNLPPLPGFLEHIRRVTKEKGIVLIFDECTSGFRETQAGLHLKYGIFPDIVMYGKALGNGYAITAVVGQRSVMEAAQNSFISSTFWTEKIGFAAANKTLEVMEQVKSWKRVTKIGRNIKSVWQEIATRNKVEITISGLDAIPSFSFKNDNLLAKTYLTQQMLGSGFLASNVMFCSTVHNQNVLDHYFSEIDKVFNELGNSDGSECIQKKLKFKVCTDGFKRLN